MAVSYHTLRARACFLHAQAEHLDAAAARLRGDQPGSQWHYRRAHEQGLFREIHLLEAAAETGEPTSGHPDDSPLIPTE
jgi:hypothetical protein